MLAAKRSLGSLRAAAKAQQASVAGPASSSCPPSPAVPRTFMSAVLLSRDQFTARTVPELKKTLAERGLSTKGRKKELVDRLVESVSRGTFGPAAATSTKASSSNSAFSTSARTEAADAESKAASQHPVANPEGKPVHTPATAGTPSNTTSSPHAAGDLASDAPPPAQTAKPHSDGAVTAAPGVVVPQTEVQKEAENADEVPGGVIEMPRAIHLPSFEQEAQESQAISMIPEPPHMYKNAPDHDADHQPFTLHPSWLKLDPLAGHVHHAGSSTTVTDDPNSRSSEPRSEKPYLDESETLLSDIMSELGIHQTKRPVQRAADEVQEKTSAILRLLEETSGVKINRLSEPIKNKPDEFKPQNRPLNNEESRGLWTLAGLLGGALLLGGFGKAKKKVEEKTEGTDEKKKH